MGQDRRKTIIVGAAIFVAVTMLILITTLSFLLKPDEATISRAFAGNMGYSAQIDDHTLYFFTGSAFAAYDLNTFTSKELTPFYALPTEITAVVFSKNGALVQATGYSAADSLYQTISNKNLNKFESYWWLFDFNTDKQTLIGEAGSETMVHEALWQDESTYVYDVRQPDGSLRLLQAKIGKGSSPIASLGQNASLEAAAQNQVFYIDTQVGSRRSLIQLNVASGQTTDLTPMYDVSDILALGPDVSMLLLANNYDPNAQPAKNDSGEGDSEGEVPLGQLLYYDSTAKKFTKIEDSFSGTAAWQPGSSDWVVAGQKASNGQSLIIFNKSNDFTKLDSKLDGNLEYLAVGRTNKGALVTNGYGDLYYASQQKIDGLPVLQDAVSLLGSNIFNSKFQMAYDGSYRQFNFYILRPPNKAGMDAALDYIRSKGIDPYQIRTKWYGADSPTF